MDDSKLLKKVLMEIRIVKEELIVEKSRNDCRFCLSAVFKVTFATLLMIIFVLIKKSERH